MAHGSHGTEHHQAYLPGLLGALKVKLTVRAALSEPAGRTWLTFSPGEVNVCGPLSKLWKVIVTVEPAWTVYSAGRKASCHCLSGPSFPCSLSALTVTLMACGAGAGAATEAALADGA